MSRKRKNKPNRSQLSGHYQSSGVKNVAAPTKNTIVPVVNQAGVRASISVDLSELLVDLVPQTEIASVQKATASVISDCQTLEESPECRDATSNAKDDGFVLPVEAEGQAPLASCQQFVLPLLEEPVAETSPVRVAPVQEIFSSTGIGIRDDRGQELLEQLNSRLGNILNEWDALQLAETISRVDSRLDAIQQLLAEAQNRLPVSGVGEELASSSRDSEALKDSTKPETQAEQNAYAPGKSWADIKLQFLRSEGIEEETSERSEPNRKSESSITERMQSSEMGDQLVLEPELQPEPVDFDLATQDELKQAVEVRDNYICYLVGKIRAIEQANPIHIDWQALMNAPFELRSRLQRLEAELEQRLRIAEVDLSLERAAISREKVRLEHWEAKLSRKSQYFQLPQESQGQSGASSQSKPTSIVKEDCTDDRISSRWWRMITFGGK